MSVFRTPQGNFEYDEYISKDVNTGATGTESGIVVTPLAANHLAINAPASASVFVCMNAPVSVAEWTGMPPAMTHVRGDAPAVAAARRRPVTSS